MGGHGWNAEDFFVWKWVGKWLQRWLGEKKKRLSLEEEAAKKQRLEETARKVSLAGFARWSVDVKTFLVPQNDWMRRLLL